jgi:predicted O-methyltransferase YrrM
MPLTYAKAHTYAAAHSSPAPSLLAHIQQETDANLPGAHMLSGHLQGRILAAFSHMLKPRRILEIGTYTGYSALCLAEGMPQDGILYTIDANPAYADRVRQYFAQAGKAHQIQYCLGKALDIIPQLAVTFDLVFIDGDKKNYPLYYELALEKLNTNGFLVIDNVLWSGKVLEEDVQKMDKKTQDIHAFNHLIRHDDRVAAVLLPIRDGLMLVRKK